MNEENEGNPIMKIVSAAEMRAIDRATSERFGVPSLTLMENAGATVSDYVLSHYTAAVRIVVFAAREIMAAMDSWRRGDCVNRGSRLR